jgi:hypothetical protein
LNETRWGGDVTAKTYLAFRLNESGQYWIVFEAAVDWLMLGPCSWIVRPGERFQMTSS